MGGIEKSHCLSPNTRCQTSGISQVCDFSLWNEYYLSTRRLI